MQLISATFLCKQAHASQNGSQCPIEALGRSLRWLLLSNLSEEAVATVFQCREYILNGFGSNETGFSHPGEEFLEGGEVDLHAGNRSPQSFAREPIL